MYKITISYKKDTSVNPEIYLTAPASTVWYGTGSSNRTKTITQNMLDAVVVWYGTDPDNTPATYSEIQIEYGTTATEYEPYFAPTTTTTLYLDAPLRQGDTYEVRSGKLIQRRAIDEYIREEMRKT